MYTLSHSALPWNKTFGRSKEAAAFSYQALFATHRSLLCMTELLSFVLDKRASHTRVGESERSLSSSVPDTLGLRPELLLYSKRLLGALRDL